MLRLHEDYQYVFTYNGWYRYFQRVISTRYYRFGWTLITTSECNASFVPLHRGYDTLKTVSSGECDWSGTSVKEYAGDRMQASLYRWQSILLPSVLAHTVTVCIVDGLRSPRYSFDAGAGSGKCLSAGFKTHTVVGDEYTCGGVERCVNELNGGSKTQLRQRQ